MVQFGKVGCSCALPQERKDEKFVLEKVAALLPDDVQLLAITLVPANPK